MKLRRAFSLPRLLLAGSLIATTAFAQLRGRDIHAGVPMANPRSGHPDTLVAEGFKLVKLAEGKDVLENPSGIITNFGLLNDFPPRSIEATRTEADENTLLEFHHRSEERRVGKECRSRW